MRYAPKATPSTERSLEAAATAAALPPWLDVPLNVAVLFAPAGGCVRSCSCSAACGEVRSTAQRSRSPLAICRASSVWLSEPFPPDATAACDCQHSMTFWQVGVDAVECSRRLSERVQGVCWAGSQPVFVQGEQSLTQ